LQYYYSNIIIILWVVLLVSGVLVFGNQALVFEVCYPERLSSGPLDGRLLLILSAKPGPEPRFQANTGAEAQPIYGIDVEGWMPGEKAVFDASVFGFPVTSLAEIPAGEYRVQVLLHVYETFTRSDGHTVKLPMDNGEGQHWNTSPGNLYSTPVKVSIPVTGTAGYAISLDRVIPPIPEPEDTDYIRHVRIQSERLTEFWGRPMFLGAVVLLPEGFNEHPEARYPLVINHDHFVSTMDDFRTEPPDPDLEPDYSARFGLQGYNRIQQQEAYDWYQTWTSPGYPRMLIVKLQHANPYYDDSYAVNSANLGPYGDAITYELIPFIEKEFRGIGAGWARFLYGGSTGGWEALAAQVMYPDEYNGCWASCPDPIDFRAYTLVNIYEDRNAYYPDEMWKKTPRPGLRNYLGEVSCTLEQMNHLELVLGTRSRSGEQWDIWEAVYSPVDRDGYPERIWDKMSGKINSRVAEYWRDNYDLRHIMERDWTALGPKLQGKISIYCGDMDNYYLNNAVYLTEEFLEQTSNPYYAGEVDYGDRAEHCWNGDHENPNAISRLRYHQMHIPKIMKRIKESAPAGADLTSWRY